MLVVLKIICRRRNMGKVRWKRGVQVVRSIQLLSGSIGLNVVLLSYYIQVVWISRRSLLGSNRLSHTTRLVNSCTAAFGMRSHDTRSRTMRDDEPERETACMLMW